MATPFRPRPHLADLPLHKIEFKSVLLVEDDRQLAEALQWVLANERYLVEVAYNGSEALRKIEANHFDAVICDVMLPQLRGDELFQRAVGTRPLLRDRFVFMTGLPDDPTVNHFLSKTSEAYLIKSFRIQTLIDCLKQRIWHV